MPTPESALIEFNEWMEGDRSYDSLSIEAKAVADDYLEGYWQNVNALCKPELPLDEGE